MAQSPHALPNPRFTLTIDSIADRIRGAITFHRRIVTGIATDRRATLEAAIVVAVAGLATAIGDRADLATGIVNALLGWAMASVTIWYLASHMLGTPTSREELLPLMRTIGYALAPVSLGIIGFVWVLGPMIGAVGTIWAFLATIAAVRYTTRFGWGRSFALTLAGGFAVAVAGFLVSLVTGFDPQLW